MYTEHYMDRRKKICDDADVGAADENGHCHGGVGDDDSCSDDKSTGQRS